MQILFIGFILQILSYKKDEEDKITIFAYILNGIGFLLISVYALSKELMPVAVICMLLFILSLIIIIQRIYYAQLENE